MKALVVYESMYGNTRAIAEAVADGLRPDYEVEVLCTAHPTASGVTSVDADLLIVGGPTHAHGMSRPATRKSAVEAALKPDSELVVEPEAEGRGIREWLSVLARGEGKPAAAFDTRLSAPPIMTGRASAGIAKRLRRLGFSQICEPADFLVDKQNHLLADQIDHARSWGRQIADAASAAK